MLNLQSKLLSLLAEGEAASARERAYEALKRNVGDTKLESHLRDSSKGRLDNSERVVIVGIGSYATQTFSVMRDSMLDRLCIDVPAAAWLSKAEEVNLLPEVARKYLTQIKGKSLMRFPMVENYHALVAPNNVFTVIELELSCASYFISHLSSTFYGDMSPEDVFIKAYSILCRAVEALAIPIGRKYWTALLCVRADEKDGNISLTALGKDVVVDTLKSLLDPDFLSETLVADGIHGTSLAASMNITDSGIHKDGVHHD